MRGGRAEAVERKETEEEDESAALAAALAAIEAAEGGGSVGGDGPDASYYVGYAEDFETPEMISAKFEELARYEEQMRREEPPSAPPPAAPSAPAAASSSSPSAPAAPSARALDLAEVFRRTSAFTVESAMAAAAKEEEAEGAGTLDDEYRGDAQGGGLWWEGYEDLLGGDSDASASDSESLSGSDDEFYGSLVERRAAAARRRRVAKRRRAASSAAARAASSSSSATSVAATAARKRRERARRLPRGQLARSLARSQHGAATVAAPAEDSYVRVPPVPVPRSWAKAVAPLVPEEERRAAMEGRFRYEETDDVAGTDLVALGGGFLGVLMSPPWDDGFTPADLARLRLPVEAMDRGFLFIWTDKRLISDVLDVATGWGFRYVENLTWVRQRFNNRNTAEDSPWIRRSKSTLLMVRRETDARVELRHQRSPDVIFDFVRRDPATGREVMPPTVYRTIETLLPTALYSEADGRGRLLELWAGGRGSCRAGWTTVVEV